MMIVRMTEANTRIVHRNKHINLPYVVVCFSLLSIAKTFIPNHLGSEWVGKLLMLFCPLDKVR